MKNILVSFVLAALCGCATPQATTPKSMRALAIRISAGDPSAFAELAATAKTLYRDINYEQEKERVLSNLVLMQSAFNELGERAGQGNTNAFAALKLSLGTKPLKSFAPDALGIAAAAGNEQALDMLLNYQQWGILKSSAVFALCEPARSNNEKAVHFLACVMANPKDQALWHGASEGLVGAAVCGNAEAQTALKKYKADD